MNRRIEAGWIAWAGVLAGALMAGASGAGGAGSVVWPGVWWSAAWCGVEDSGLGESAREPGEDLIARCLSVAEDVDGSYARALRALRETDEEAFRKKLIKSRDLLGLARLKEHDPSGYELKVLEIRTDAAVRRLAGEARARRGEGRKSEAEKLERELRQQVILQRGFRIRAREEYLCRLEGLAARVEGELEWERVPSNFEVMVDRRVSELLEERKGDDGRDGAMGERAIEGLHPVGRPVGGRVDAAGWAKETLGWDGRLAVRERVRGRELSPEMVERCLTVAQDVDVRLSSELRRLRATDEESFRQRLRVSPRLLALARLKERDPTLYELKLLELNVDAEASRLADGAREARREGREEEAGRLIEQLRVQVILQLGLSIRAREDHLGRLQEVVGRLGVELDEEREGGKFERGVDERMGALLEPQGAHPRRPGGSAEGRGR